jgi:uncharacterized membrane protein YoaT (DUF817 family)
MINREVTDYQNCLVMSSLSKKAQMLYLKKFLDKYYVDHWHSIVTNAIINKFGRTTVLFKPHQTASYPDE